MKVFINDWDGDMNKFVMNVEENREYPINEWVVANDGSRVYLASAYVYDEFVMFFYIYELKHSDIYSELTIPKIPQTQRDVIMQPSNIFNRVSFEYEVNHLKSESGRSGDCLPRQKPENMPEEERDEFFEMYYGEYDYLCDLMKDRLPKELRGASLAFRKDCYSFADPVTEIEHIAVYPPSNEVRRCFIDKTFTIPYGKCDIKIPYSADGEQSYIIARELKIIDMLESFEEQYDELKKARENSLLGVEKGKGRENQTVMDMDEIRQHWDKRLLTLSYLKPEEKRAFEFYTTEYLNSKIPRVSSTSGTFTSVAYFYSPDEDDRMEEGLYKGTSALGEVHDAPKAEYEITLMWVSIPVGRERKSVFAVEFS